MRNFDVELAKKGWPVITRNGHKARVVCYDRISANGHGTLAVLVALYEPITEVSVFSDADGRCDYVPEGSFDLFLTDTWEGHDENGNPIEDKSQDYSERIGEPKPDSHVNEQRPENLVKFGNILDSMFRIYEAKNHDYGDSFGQSIKSYGPIAGLTRISDKFHRLESLILKGEQKVQDESLKDTLIDMANYCVMLRMALDKNKQ